MGRSRFRFGLLFAILGAGGVVGSLITEPAPAAAGAALGDRGGHPGHGCDDGNPAFTANRWAIGAAAFVGGVGP